MVLTINVVVGLDDVSPNVSSSVAGGETGVWTRFHDHNLFYATSHTKTCLHNT